MILVCDKIHSKESQKLPVKLPICSILLLVFRTVHCAAPPQEPQCRYHLTLHPHTHCRDLHKVGLGGDPWYFLGPTRMCLTPAVPRFVFLCGSVSGPGIFFSTLARKTIPGFWLLEFGEIRGRGVITHVPPVTVIPCKIIPCPFLKILYLPRRTYAHLSEYL